MTSSSSIKYSFSLFPWGYSCRYKAHCEMSKDKLILLSAKLTDSDYIKKIRTEKELINIRGRDDGELIFLAGELVVDDDIEEIPENLDFSGSLITSYSSSSAKKIVHSLSEKLHGELPYDMSILDLPHLVPASLSTLRFGLVKYSPRKVAGYFGLAPISTGHILLEANDKELNLEITDDGLSSKYELPWDKHEALIALDWALRESCGFGVLEDLG